MLNKSERAGNVRLQRVMVDKISHFFEWKGGFCWSGFSSENEHICNILRKYYGITFYASNIDLNLTISCFHNVRKFTSIEN